MEIHAHVRSAHPRVALFFSAAILAAVLGLAQWQVAYETALQDPVSIPGIDITFQPPHGWIAAKEIPGVYELYVDESGSLLKRLQLRFVALPPKLPEVARPAKIGDLPAMQFRTLERHGRDIWWVVSRYAKTPRNEMLVLSLHSRAQINLGDLDMLDAVARSVKITGNALVISPAELLDKLGINAAIPSSWQASNHWTPEIAGGHLAPPPTNGASWSAELARSFASAKPELENILIAAAEVQGIHREELKISAGKTATGIDYQVALPAIDESHPLAAIWLLHLDRREVLLVTLKTESVAVRRAAMGMLEPVLMSMEFKAPFPDEPLDRLITPGEALVKKIIARGPKPWWGREAEETYLVGPRGESRVLAMMHAARHGDPNLGYYGLTVQYTPLSQIQIAWSLAADASYEWAMKHNSSGPLGARQQTVANAEQFDAIRTRLTRSGGLSVGEASSEIATPAGFLPQPMELLAYYQVAIGQAPDCILTLSDGRSPGLHECLLRRLEPSAGGAPRVLVQRTIRPDGWIFTFDDGPHLLKIESSFLNLRQVSRSAAQRENPDLKQFPSLKTFAAQGR
jgi:hypothetical protein